MYNMSVSQIWVAKGPIMHTLNDFFRKNSPGTHHIILSRIDDFLMNQIILLLLVSTPQTKTLSLESSSHSCGRKQETIWNHKPVYVTMSQSPCVHGIFSSCPHLCLNFSDLHRFLLSLSPHENYHFLDNKHRKKHAKR